jgi:hypothetical protein
MDGLSHLRVVHRIDLWIKESNGDVLMGAADRGAEEGMLESTVGSCWDQPSALLPINRRLNHL